jgi:hypothetical protein
VRRSPVADTARQWVLTGDEAAAIRAAGTAADLDDALRPVRARWVAEALEEAAAHPTVVEQVTEYRVSAAPLDHADGWRFALIVRWDRSGTWMVTDGAEPPDYMGADGLWSWETPGEQHAEGWRDAYRFDLPTALRIAREAAPKVRVNGRPWPEWQAHFAQTRSQG